MVLCALAVVLTIVGAINAFEPLSLGFSWSIEQVEAAFNWASERNPIGAAWDWALANDLPQGWAILVGVIIGLALIAWQLRIGFRNLGLSHANQAELDRQASREGALLEREAREHQAELQAQAQEAAQQKEAIVFAAALRGELMAAAYQLSSRLIWLEGVQKILDELATDPTNRFPTPFEIERIATPVYDANAPRLGTIDASLAADVAQVYAFLSAEHRWNEPGGRDPTLFKALIEKIRSANSVHLKDIVHVCKRLIAFELRKPDDDPGPLTEARKEWSEPLSELLEEGYVERFRPPFFAGGIAMQEYGSDKLVVRYDPAICIHAGECVRGLPSVFNLSKKPWIDVNGASAAAVIEQVKRCPSGALTYELPKTD